MEILRSQEQEPTKNKTWVARRRNYVAKDCEYLGGTRTVGYVCMRCVCVSYVNFCSLHSTFPFLFELSITSTECSLEKCKRKEEKTHTYIPI